MSQQQNERHVLEVENLAIEYQGAAGPIRIVEDVSLSVRRGEIFGLVGESGSGKSSVINAVLGHVRMGGRITAGSVRLEGRDILGKRPGELARIRGREIGFVPQNPATGLSPHLRIGDQIRELLAWHRITTDRQEADRRIVEYLGLVGLPTPVQLMRRYPHEISGGQQQRVCIAMALICSPKLVLLDEPTTGLDVTTQAQIVSLLLALRKRLDMAILYVTHDLGVLSQLADRVGVMYAGRLVEIGESDILFSNPRHPYTRGLISSIPSLDHEIDRNETLRGLLRRGELPAGCPFSPRCRFAEDRCRTEPQHLQPIPGGRVACRRWAEIEALQPPQKAGLAERLGERRREPVLKIQDLTLDYRGNIDKLNARPTVPSFDLELMQGEMLGLVGESGSGKSTIARAISGLVPGRGEIRLRGETVPLKLRQRSKALKREIQYVFQNPDASLNPKSRIWQVISRPLRTYFGMRRRDVATTVRDILRDVSLDESYAMRRPRQLSGGEKQRIAIARGLVAKPSVLLCDEILSALDVSVQANIMQLIVRLRQESDVSMIFISHDLAVVRQLSDRVAVLYHGELVEIGEVEDIFKPPYHPYTLELLNAVPEIGRPATGETAAVAARLTDDEARHGCIFRARCRQKIGAICETTAPPWRETQSGLRIRCHHDLPELSAAAPHLQGPVSIAEGCAVTSA